jgi:cysteine desulfurase/selenocysteine lyase
MIVIYKNQSIAHEFPALKQTVYGKRLVYLDNAATAQKPQSVLDAMASYYQYDNANVHRGVHQLSQRADAAYEGVRKKVANFIHAQSSDEIIFTPGATHAINLVATSFGQAFVKAGDEIIISAMEHHANIVPWQLLCERTGAVLKVLPITEAGELCIDDLDDMITERTKLVAMVHISNVLGTINPIETVIKIAHAKGVPVLVDAAQSIHHVPIDVQAMDCDFLVFSGHKMYGPTGIGVLYGKKSWLNRMPPYQGGGNMIEEVSFEKSTYHVLPYKFEAGTPNIAGVVGLGATCDFLTRMDMKSVEAHEHEMATLLLKALVAIPGLNIIGRAKRRIALVSFTLDGIHAHDIATILDKEGVAVRAGHHCAMPLMNFYQVSATVRASMGVYNTTEDIEALVKAIYSVKEVFDHG